MLLWMHCLVTRTNEWDMRVKTGSLKSAILPVRLYDHLRDLRDTVFGLIGLQLAKQDRCRRMFESKRGYIHKAYGNCHDYG